MLNKRNLDVSRFASKEESRYTLTAIQVTPNETVATDGHRLGWVSVNDGVKSENFPVVAGALPAVDTFKPFLLPAERADKIGKAIPKKSNIPILKYVAIGAEQGGAEGDEPRRTLAVTDLESPQVFDATRQPSGQFPNYQAVIPKWDAAKIRFCVNPEYLAEIAQFVAEMKDGKRDTMPSIVISLYDEENSKAIRFDASASDGQGFTAVLMPLRAHCNHATREYITSKHSEPEPIQWIQPLNTYGQADARKAQAEAEAKYAADWDAAHAEEIDRAWDLAHAEDITRNDPFANTQSYPEVAFKARLMGDAEPEPEPSTTLYVNVPVSETLQAKLQNHVQRNVGNGGDFVNVYTRDTHLVRESIHFLALYGVVVTEVSPVEHAPAGFIRNATPRERVKQRIPISILDMMPKKIDARPVPAKTNPSVIDAANSF